MAEKRLQSIIIILLCLVLIRGLIYGLFIPFDRAPDESHHFKLIKAKQLQLNHTLEEEEDYIAAQIGLTRYYLQHPEANPQKYSLQDFSGQSLPKPPSSSHIYYFFTAWILKILSLDEIRDEIYLLRGFSILCGMIIVLLSFLVTREIFPESFFLMISVPTLIAFIPQFSAMNGAINDDKFTEVFLSFMFWLMVKIFKRGMSWGYVFGFIAMMGLALLSKRTAMFTFPFFPVVLFVYYWKTSIGIRMHLLLLLILLGIALGGYHLAWYVDEMGGFIGEYVVWIPPHKFKEFLSQSYSVEALKYYAKFFIVIYWSFWGVFGYMTIHLHHFWYLLTALVQFLSICGLLGVVFQIKVKKLIVESWKVKTLYLFAVSIIFLIIVIVLRSIVFRPDDPFLAQGRRLFAAIIPISVLTMCGLENLIPLKYHRLVGTIGIIGLLILDIVCLSNYILLNFHNISFF